MIAWYFIQIVSRGDHLNTLSGHVLTLNGPIEMADGILLFFRENKADNECIRQKTFYSKCQALFSLKYKRNQNVECFNLTKHFKG